MRTVRVPLAGREYSILIDEDLIPRMGASCRRLGLGQRCAIITDDTVAPLYADTAMASLETAGFSPILITVPAGETSKSLKSVGACYDQLAKHRLERRSFVVALGGGVVGDLAGFVAASYLRGVDFVQVPTTLLAQVDSSVGGKVGVNLKAGKNLVGAFHQPRLVLCDLSALRSLPPREFRAGLAEVIKYGIIWDPRLFARLEKNLDAVLNLEAKTVKAIVARCCQIKADVVGEDEREGGLRAILNFGHTIGHAVENTAGYGHFLHGEAISIGQVAAAWLSTWTLGLPTPDVERIVTLFRRTELPVTLPLTSAWRQRLLRAMLLDKKVQNGEVTFVLAKRIGQVEFGHRVGGELLQRALDRIAR